MTSDLEYLLLKEKGPYHEVYVRRRLNANPGTCRFYTIVFSIISISLILLLFSLVYVFVLVPSWQGSVLSWDGRTEQEAKIHVLTHTQCGLAEGLVEKGVYVFKGIPYAVPPVGSRRWREPVRMSGDLGTCWRGTFQAKTFGSSCVQTRALGKLSSVVGSEDCLFLNVWTQSLDPLASRPVMFWIHGGDFMNGSGNSPPMSPTPEVTKSTHAVYVSINYRLGPFGFLSLDALSQNSSSGTSGNYGLLDTILALEWVRDNIRNFGGNPNKVTVFGQDSGAAMIQALLTSSSVQRLPGLFHRAWVASPSPAVLNKTSSQASLQNLVLLNLTECPDATCLRRLSASEVMRGNGTARWSSSKAWNLKLRSAGEEGSSGVPAPKERRRRLDADALTVVVDGHMLKESPLQAWKHGRGRDLPIVFTTTAQETDLIPFDPTISTWTWQHFRATVTQQLTRAASSSSSSQQRDVQHMAHTVLELYRQEPTFTPEYQYTTLLSDVRMTCPVDVLARAAASAGKFRSPVFRGVITASPSTPVNLLNVSAARFAFHGWDMLAFFGDFEAFGFLHPSAEDLRFQKVMREQVMSFAREGRPEAPVWDSVRMCTALLSDHVFPMEHYSRSRCDFWLRNGFVLS